MKIGTYNVLGLTGYPAVEAAKVIGPAGSEANADHFAGVFAELDCDILALQEGIAVRAIQQVAKRMGYYVATAASPIAWPGHVLSRYPIVESRTLSHTGPLEQVPPFSRTIGATLLQVAPDQLLWLVNVHLHPGDVALREREADILRQKLQELMAVTENIIVVGDFNSEISEKIHGHLRDMEFANAMQEVGGGIEATMDTVGINIHYIDHIYCSKTMAPKMKNARVVRDAGFRHDGPQVEGVWVHSDHLPVVAELSEAE
jgi:endonuclease/exonuclease/phosphatase family metal-dependent hydrolase